MTLYVEVPGSKFTNIVTAASSGSVVGVAAQVSAAAVSATFTL
ncbi:MAG: hypothetical protein U0235_10050 [Polyangiaceae bacterium]